MSGIFISFEGIDGAGKSSHVEALAVAFRQQLQPGQQLVLTREPGGTALSEKLRELILHEPMDAMTEALLVFAARREHIVQVIAPALARGDVVLCDRFTDASFAYQGAGRGFDSGVLLKLEHFAQDSCRLEADLASKIHFLKTCFNLISRCSSTCRRRWLRNAWPLRVSPINLNRRTSRFSSVWHRAMKAEWPHSRKGLRALMATRLCLKCENKSWRLYAHEGIWYERSRRR